MWIKFRIRTLIRRTVLKVARYIARHADYYLIKKTPYCSIPELPDQFSARWERKTDLAGIHFEITAQLAWLKKNIAPFFSEFFSSDGRYSNLFHLISNNEYYQCGDAEVLYGMVRHLKPRRILELGTGFSTMIMAIACALNQEEGRTTDFVTIDTEYRSSIPESLSPFYKWEHLNVQDIPLVRFQQLGEGDILFVDTSHTVKWGSDVNFIVLEVLPRLKPGVIVHFHDIFVPWDYPREWLLRGTYLAEQYLLQAYLSENEKYEILVAMYALARICPEELAALIPAYRPHYNGPSSIWLRSNKCRTIPMV